MRYTLKFQEIAANTRTQNKELFASADEIFDFSVEALSNAQNIGRNRTSDIIQATAALYVKSLRLFRASLLLVEQGLIRESFALERIEFECLLYLMWLNKDDSLEIRTRRSHDLLAWQVVTHNKALKKIVGQEDNQDPRITETLNKIQPYMDILKNRMTDEEFKEYVKNGPFRDDRTIEAVAKYVGMSGAYNRIYKIGSEVIHCQDLLNYAEKNPVTGALSLNDWDERGASASLGSAIITQFGAMAMTNRLLRLDLTDKMRVINAKLRRQYPAFEELFPNGWS